MNKQTLVLMAIGVLAVGIETRADTVIFSDNFNSEDAANANVGFLNYGTPLQNGQGGAGTQNTSFAQWTVTGGSVDLLPIPVNTGPYPGPYALLPSTYGLYVDLDGTTGQNGTLTSEALSLGVGSYKLFFDMAGSQRGQADTALVSVQTGVTSTTVSVASSDPMKTYELDFTLTAPKVVQLSFQDTTNPGDDDIGPLLDNVVLDMAGAPDNGSTVILLGMGLLGLATFRRKLAC